MSGAAVCHPTAPDTGQSVSRCAAYLCYHRLSCMLP